jgi:hypothetical protein
MEKLFTAQDLSLATALGDVGFTNPFGVERIALEKQILGSCLHPCFSCLDNYPNASRF